VNAAEPQLSARETAERAQRRGSDPAVSAFVSASAGSGKTKLLTDRLLRLMLAGADPGRIQCLTFTKAGAAEMAVRLQRRLGAWVTAADAQLNADLHALALDPDDTLRAAARTLFARVLDLPGGMRIGTIHAFCQSLLRRFPLEAALSPHFELLDETAARALQQQAREQVLRSDGVAESIEAIAPQLQLDGFSALVRALQDRRERLDAALAHGLPALESAQRRVLGLAPDEDENTILRTAIDAMDLPTLREVLAAVETNLNTRLAEKVPAALRWLAAAPPADVRDWHAWATYFLRQDFEPCHHTYLVSAATEKAFPDTRKYLLEEQERVCAVLERLRAAQVARLSAHLLRLVVPALNGYDAAKTATGRLDYADLIGHARALLREPGAAWVLYKLDGGLDHLLLDEVQDTAPDQWQIADALTEEFFAGVGARETALPRTIFAVGDKKQSIFSFQGAAPEGFDTWRKTWRRRTEAAGAQWRDVQLDVSFRSTAPVLALVDAVFADASRLGIRDQPVLAHQADRAGQAGRVELWPPVPLVVPPKPEPWEAPTATRETPSAPQLLAEALADWIAAQTNGSVMLESRGRPLHAGDILVLVRSRGSFDRALLRALKTRRVPVAGLDRMVLTEQPAVADLLALCDTLLLPSDDLSLAAVLTSPLGNLTDASLMDLALGRTPRLWETLRARALERPDWHAAHAFLETLFRRVDYVTPHALLAEALGPLGGRARLFARLGPQAAEAIDELLNTAIAYAQRYPPNLQGFVHWLRQSGSEVKREAEGAARELRIMTVHGAKGLQAPVVILPATTGLSERRPTLVWAPDPHTGAPVPLWGPRKDTHDAVMRQTLQTTIDQEREEHYRLLYVALTRAEDRLLVCGWQPARGKQECWYDLIRDGFTTLSGHQTAPFAAIAKPWDGDALSYATPQRDPPVLERATEARPDAPLPSWAGAAHAWLPEPPPPEPATPALLAPSRPQDNALGAVPQAASPLALRDATGRRFRRGQIMHALLQHVPNLPPSDRQAAAAAYLARPDSFLTSSEAASLVAELMALLTDPTLAPLFGPGSRAEVPLTGVIDTPDGPAVVGGLVDRLVELPDRILVADYKTNRDPPPDAAHIPSLYINQMNSYRDVLTKIFPDRQVDCALIWTRTGKVDWIGRPGALPLDRAGNRGPQTPFTGAPGAAPLALP
jgi:ATP-dependent helicase/nuclease subunit A